MSIVLPTINGHALHVREATRAQQGYQLIPPPRWRRTLSGRLVARPHWRSLASALSGEAWLAPALLDLDLSEPVALGCVAPLAISIGAAETIVALPFDVRDDLQRPVWCHGVVDGAPVHATCTRAGRLVSVDANAQASGYRVLWYPLLRVLASLGGAASSREAASTQWTLDAELVDGATSAQLAAVATEAARSAIAGGATLVEAGNAFDAALAALGTDSALPIAQQRTLVAVTVGAAGIATSDAQRATIAGEVHAALAADTTAGIDEALGAVVAGGHVADAGALRTTSQGALDNASSGFDNLNTSATVSTDTTEQIIPGLDARLAKTTAPAAVTTADAVLGQFNAGAVALAGTLPVPAGATWTLVVRFVDARGVAGTSFGYDLRATTDAGAYVFDDAAGQATRKDLGEVTVTPDNWDTPFAGDAPFTLYEQRWALPAADATTFRDFELTAQQAGAESLVVSMTYIEADVVDQ